MCPPHLGRFSFGFKSFLIGLFPCARLAIDLAFNKEGFVWCSTWDTKEKADIKPFHSVPAAK